MENDANSAWLDASHDKEGRTSLGSDSSFNLNGSLSPTTNAPTNNPTAAADFYNNAGSQSQLDILSTDEQIPMSPESLSVAIGNTADSSAAENTTTGADSTTNDVVKKEQTIETVTELQDTLRQLLKRVDDMESSCEKARSETAILKVYVENLRKNAVFNGNGTATPR